MHQYWEDHPPVHLLVAAFVGYKKKEKPKEKSIEELKEMFGQFGLGG